MWKNNAIRNSPCDTAGLEQLLVNGILKLPGVTVESSQCLLFILLVVTADEELLPQLTAEPGDDALAGIKQRKKKN